MSIYGVWRHETVGEGFTSTLTNTLREDGSYEVHMMMGATEGCQQHIYHYGQFKLDEGQSLLKITFDSGERETTDCPDAADNIARRTFTPDEVAETLAQLSLPKR